MIKIGIIQQPTKNTHSVENDPSELCILCALDELHNLGGGNAGGRETPTGEALIISRNWIHERGAEDPGDKARHAEASPQN